MALDQAVIAPLAIGVGCRRDCSADTIVAAVRAACGTHDMTGAALFTLDAKRNEVGLHQAAVRLGLPLCFLPTEELETASDRVLHRSRRVEAAVGVVSVAESAALVGAGAGSRLLVPRMTFGSATCAVAVRQGAEL